MTRPLEEAPHSPAGAQMSASTTVAELATWWVRNVASRRVRPSSLGKYEDRVERITAWLGDVRIGSLRAEQVATWQTEPLTKLSPGTVSDTRATFLSVMDEAVALELVKANPVSRVRSPERFALPSDVR